MMKSYLDLRYVLCTGHLSILPRPFDASTGRKNNHKVPKPNTAQSRQFFQTTLMVALCLDQTSCLHWAMSAAGFCLPGSVVECFGPGIARFQPMSIQWWAGRFAKKNGHHD